MNKKNKKTQFKPTKLKIVQMAYFEKYLREIQQKVSKYIKLVKEADNYAGHILTENIYELCLKSINLYEKLDISKDYFLNQHLSEYLRKAVDIRYGHFNALSSAMYILNDLKENYIIRNIN